MIFPLKNIAHLSPYLLQTSISWDTIITVLPMSVSLFNISANCFLYLPSKPLVGSSSINISGSLKALWQEPPSAVLLLKYRRDDNQGAFLSLRSLPFFLSFFLFFCCGFISRKCFQKVFFYRVFHENALGILRKHPPSVH